MKTQKSFFIALGVLFCAPSWAWTLVGTGVQGWSSRTLTIHWNFSACSLPESTLTTALDRAIDAWNSANGLDLHLVRAAAASTTSASDFLAGTASGTPLIVCDTNFGANQGTDANYVPASTRVSMPSGPIEYGGVLLNAESGAAANVENIADGVLAVILAHELGHVFGLGHSSVANALMYYNVTNKTSPIVTEDDLDGMSFLYPRNELSGGMFGCAFVSPQANQSTGAMPFVIGLLFLISLASSVSLGRRLSAHK